MALLTLFYACYMIITAHSITANFLFTEQITDSQLLGSHFGVPDTPTTYDYVIVGGGTAGLTIARRLAANTSITVAVIEAGGFYELDNGNYSEIPGYASQFTGTDNLCPGILASQLTSPSQVGESTRKNPLIDWYQFVTPQPGLGGRAPLYASGKTLGGGSARNFLQYQRYA
jgi:choline dehydrogenase